MNRKIIIDQILIEQGAGLTIIAKEYISTHNMLNVGKINGKRYLLPDNTPIYIHNTDKHIIITKL